MDLFGENENDRDLLTGDWRPEYGDLERFRNIGERRGERPGELENLDWGERENDLLGE